MKKRAKKYTADMPRTLYKFFVNAVANGEIPSISKFARYMAITVEDVERFRLHAEFEKAYKEANEIRRDYLIDSALTRRYDPSFTKFLIGEEFESGIGKDEAFSVDIRMVDE